ncbi:MAG TPA: DUF3060 domain-containing protein [Kofleriaceae bacterium]|jgi:hypothetical protein|nr:DUF3060 domain-containing protein [Kofleriaceae bacterium]
MKTGIALLFGIAVIAPRIAQADKTFIMGKGAAWNCAKDPVISINHGAATYTFTGKCVTINVSGGENKLTIESVDTLNITGSKNTVTVGTVDAINVTGSNNKVTYKAAKSGNVTSHSSGNNNAIDQAK